MVDVWDGPPREGTRGGLEQFKWDSVKGEAMRDRECYLGQSVRIGMQGKFGRFNTHDWWRTERGDKGRDPIEKEVESVKQFEEALMQEALGLKPKNLLLLKGKQPEPTEGEPDANDCSSIAPVPEEAKTELEKDPKKALNRQKESKRSKKERKRDKKHRRRSGSVESGDSSKRDAKNKKQSASYDRGEDRDRRTSQRKSGRRGDSVESCDSFKRDARNSRQTSSHDRDDGHDRRTEEKQHRRRGDSVESGDPFKLDSKRRRHGEEDNRKRKSRGHADEFEREAKNRRNLSPNGDSEYWRGSQSRRETRDRRHYESKDKM
eukprot:Selendium_serpulae@DN5741_c0_g1_i1.p1